MSLRSALRNLLSTCFCTLGVCHWLSRLSSFTSGELLATDSCALARRRLMCGLQRVTSDCGLVRSLLRGRGKKIERLRKQICLCIFSRK